MKAHAVGLEGPTQQFCNLALAFGKLADTRFERATKSFANQIIEASFTGNPALASALRKF